MEQPLGNHSIVIRIIIIIIRVLNKDIMDM